MNVVDNLNSVQVINKPCVYSSTMRLSTFCGLHRDAEHVYTTLMTLHEVPREPRNIFLGPLYSRLCQTKYKCFRHHMIRLQYKVFGYGWSLWFLLFTLYNCLVQSTVHCSFYSFFQFLLYRDLKSKIGFFSFSSHHSHGYSIMQSSAVKSTLLNLLNLLQYTC